MIVLTTKWRNPGRPIGTQNSTSDGGGSDAKNRKCSKFRFNYNKSETTYQEGWHTEESEHHRVERSYWGLGAIFAGITILFTAIAAGGAIWAAIVSTWSFQEARKTTIIIRQQTNAAIEQNTLSFPAKLRVAEIEIKWEDDSDIKTLIPNRTVIGTATLVNEGRKAATIQSGYCVPYWGGRSLPMHNVVENKHTGCITKPQIGIDGKSRIEAGGYIRIKFSTVVPDNKSLTLYFVGWFVYSDDVTEHMFIKYARQFDLDSHKFKIVNDPEYETE